MGTNLVTGDYSRGASGLWIENGELDLSGERGDHRRPSQRHVRLARAGERSRVPLRHQRADRAGGRTDRCGHLSRPHARRSRTSLRPSCARRARSRLARSATRSSSPGPRHGGSPVTEADIAVDRFLRERLTRLAPDCGWLSEETRGRPRAARRARGCGSSIRSTARAPMSPAAPTGRSRSRWWRTAARSSAAIFAPVEDGLYLAVAGEGATRDGVPITANAGGDFDGRACRRPEADDRRACEKSAPGIVAEPKVHSLALRLARVAAGTLDIAFASKNSHDWDLAAADLIVHEAGGALTTFDGPTPSSTTARSRATARWSPPGAARHERADRDHARLADAARLA